MQRVQLPGAPPAVRADRRASASARRRPPHEAQPGSAGRARARGVRPALPSCAVHAQREGDSLDYPHLDQREGGQARRAARAPEFARIVGLDLRQLPPLVLQAAHGEVQVAVLALERLHLRASM